MQSKDVPESFNVVSHRRPNSHQPDARTPKGPIQEDISLASIFPRVRGIIELDGKQDRCGLFVVENKIHVLLAEPPSVRPLPQLIRTLQHIRQPRLN